MAERKICACVSDAAASPLARPKIKMYKSAFDFYFLQCFAFNKAVWRLYIFCCQGFRVFFFKYFFGLAFNRGTAFDSS